MFKNFDEYISELKLRDPKGLYKKYSQGQIKNLAGVDFPIDKPKNADILITNETAERSVEIIIEKLDEILANEN